MPLHLLKLGVGLGRSYMDLVHRDGGLGPPTIEFLGHDEGLNLVDGVRDLSRWNRLCMHQIRFDWIERRWA